MSHLGIYSTRIKNANLNIARRALELLAKEKDLQLSKEYKNRYGVHIKANVGIIPGIASGFGVNITRKGELEIMGDPYGGWDAFHSAHERFVQLYQAIAINQALEMLGYRTEAQFHSDQRIILVGEKTS